MSPIIGTPNMLILFSLSPSPKYMHISSRNRWNIRKQPLLYFCINLLYGYLYRNRDEDYQPYLDYIGKNYRSKIICVHYIPAITIYQDKHAVHLYTLYNSRKIPTKESNGFIKSTPNLISQIGNRQVNTCINSSSTPPPPYCDHI